MTNEQLPLWIRWKNISAAVRRDRGYSSQNYTRPENERVVSISTCEDACVDFTGMYEGIKAVKQIQSFLQAGLLLYLNSFQPSPLYHKKDLVSLFKGSLTVLSRSMHVCFFSPPPLTLSSGQQPCFYHFYSLHKGKAFQDSQESWNAFVLLLLVSLSTNQFASGLKRQNRKECKVRPPHDVHTVFWPAQGGLLINTLPTPPSETGDVVLLCSKPNKILKNMSIFLYAEYDGLFVFFNQVVSVYDEHSRLHHYYHPLI